VEIGQELTTYRKETQWASGSWRRLHSDELHQTSLGRPVSEYRMDGLYSTYVEMRNVYKM
jgi:hypothetical protein